MNVRLIFSCAVTICALSVFAGLANEESRNIPESTSTRIVTDYAKAWIAGDIEKMYASFPPGRFSFAE